jgi:hypothetical protein
VPGEIEPNKLYEGKAQATTTYRVTNEQTKASILVVINTSSGSGRARIELPSGYYTVCEIVPDGYTTRAVQIQGQEVRGTCIYLFLGEGAVAPVYFVNTEIPAPQPLPEPQPQPVPTGTTLPTLPNTGSGGMADFAGGITVGAYAVNQVVSTDLALASADTALTFSSTPAAQMGAEVTGSQSLILAGLYLVE